MTDVGLIKQLSSSTRTISDRLRDQAYLRKSRIHPLKVLVALRTYAQGHGVRGKLRWKPSSRIIDALDDAFYLSFGNVESTGKRMCLALDVSGSMSAEIAGMPILCCEATAAMSMVTARSEPNYYITAFSHRLVQLSVSPRQRLDDVMRMTYDRNFGGTDCALPMLEATKMRIPVDAFVIYTDNESWFSNYGHPSQALERYRAAQRSLHEYQDRMGIGAKLVAVGMTATRCTIADTEDVNSMSVVGFDTATPQLISSFIAD
jgi:60 kDa SS-A/Ro ribonucleoprotein